MAADSLLDEPKAHEPRPFAKRYVYALVTKDTKEIQLPVHASRQDAKEALQWRPDADNLKVERCRLLQCRR